MRLLHYSDVENALDDPERAGRLAGAIRTHADVSVVNVGMLRAGPPFSGEVTTGGLRGLTPFDNEVWTATLPGRDLRTLFAGFSGVRQAHSPNEVHGHVGGASLTWRWTDEGAALADATVGGEPIDAAGTYEVAAPTFLFTVEEFPGLTRERASESGPHQCDALVDYVQERGFSPVDGRMRVTDGARGDRPRSTHSLQ